MREKFYLEVKSISAYNNSFELLVKDLHQYKKQGYRIALLSGSRTRAERLAKDLQEEGLAAFYGQDYDREICRARSWWFMAMQRRALNTR